ncbi:MAG: carbohydrate binding domain-containing protein [Fibrobacterota bacterium]
MRRFLITSVAALSVSAFATNALSNGGFENGMEGWMNEGGEVSPESHDGELALMVRQTAARWAGAWRKVSIPDGVRTVKASGWLRSDSVRGGQGSWERGRLSIEFHDAKGDTVGGFPLAVGQVRGKTPWTRMERVYAVPQGAKWLKLECALGNATGTLYCDDIAVTLEP